MKATSPATDRREQIIAAALELVREGGVAGASVRAVAARAGIGASTMRYYFPRQRDLNDAIAARSLAVELHDLRIHDPTVDPAERLFECLAQFLPPSPAEIAQLTAWLDLLHAALTRGDDTLPAQMLAGFTRAAHERLTAWLRQLASEGRLEPGESEHHAVALMSRIDGLCLALLGPTLPITLEDARGILRRDVEVLLRRA